MATRDLTTRMRAIGARAVSRDFKRVARAADEVGDQSRGAAKGAGIMAQSLTLLTTRLGAAGIAAVALLVPLGPGIVAATALAIPALLALGGIMVGIFAVGMTAAKMYENQMKIAGTAANDLKRNLEDFQGVWMRMMRPAVNKLFAGLAAAIAEITPMVKTLRPAFSAFGGAMADALVIVAQGVRELGPEIRTFLTQSAGLIPLAARAFAPLLGVLLDLGTAGIPILRQVVTWITQFAFWLRPAMKNTIAWEKRTKTLQTILSITGGVVAFVGGVLFDLGRIIWGVVQAMIPFAAAVGPPLLAALKWIADAIDWIADNMDAIGPPLATFIITIGALRLALMAARGAMWLLSLAFKMSPIGRIITLLALLVTGVIYAYNHWDWFRNAVDNVWAFIRNNLLPALQDVWTWIKRAFGDAVDHVLPRIQTLVDAVKYIVEKAGAVARVADKVKGPSAMDVAGVDKPSWAGPSLIDVVKKVGGGATGGTVRRGGPLVVGERGPEIADLPTGAQLTPNHQLGGPVVVHANLVVDGQVLARQTLRAARQKASVR